MIVVPEIETVVVLPPRTGSKTVTEVVRRTWPGAWRPYRHMEADGVPHGHDRWRRVGVARHPLRRLWSLHCYLRSGGVDDKEDAHAERMRRSVEPEFSEWLVANEVVFTNPHDSGGGLRFWPQYCVMHSLPENKKSQFLYLRPDLGTEIFASVGELLGNLGADPALLGRSNVGAHGWPVPELTAEAQLHLERFHSWDLEHGGDW